MRLFPNAADVLDALGAWDDSYGTGNPPALRAEAKAHAELTLTQFVWGRICAVLAVWIALDLLAIIVRAIF